MPFPLDTTGSELAIYPQDDAAAVSNGQNAPSLIDYSGKGRNLTGATTFPIYQKPSINGKTAVLWDGTKNPLKNAANFTVKCGFMVLRIDETTFSNFAGILTDTVNFPILVGSQGTASFFDNLQKANRYEYRSSDRIYPAANAPAPMNAYKIIFFRYGIPVSVNGIQIGQDRADTARKAKMSLALLALYSSDFCEEGVRKNLQILAGTFNLPISDVFPFYVQNDSAFRDVKAVNMDFPSSGGMISEVLGGVKFEAELKFLQRRPSETEAVRDFLVNHYGIAPFIFRSFAFSVPRDYEGYATSLIEYSADGESYGFSFREN